MIDKVIVGVNNDNYPIIKIRIRTERIPGIGDKFACYDDQTEVLTDKGWVFFKDLTMKHKVATLIGGEVVPPGGKTLRGIRSKKGFTQGGDTLDFQYPTEIMEYDYKDYNFKDKFDGEMYLLETKQVNLCVTPNHNLWTAPKVGKNQRKIYRTQEAREILHTIRHYQKNVAKVAHCSEDKYPFYYGDEIIISDGFVTLPEVDQLPNLTVTLEHWLWLVGIWVAEGFWKDKWMISISAHKPRVKRVLKVICEENNLKLSKHKTQGNPINGEIYNQWNICDKRIAAYFKTISQKAIHKFLPKWVWCLNVTYSRELIYGMMLGDGHWELIKNGDLREDDDWLCCGNMQYDTSSNTLVDDFQRLCLQAGWSCNRKKKCDAGVTKIIREQEVTTTVPAWRLGIITCQNNPFVNKTIKSDKMIKYDGKVYCCTVSSHVIYVRRNGKPVWCGQSAHGQKGTVGITPHRADFPFTSFGLKPDIIINPNCIGRRMTIGQLIECVLSKLCAIKGVYGDATPFTGIDLHAINNALIELGYGEWGNDIMYCGKTGQKMEHPIFIGPTFYQRLKQMVADKAHCLSLDHEVLTLDGWKFNHQLTLNDKVATLVDGKLVYQHPTKILNYPKYKGDMYSVKTEQLDLKVTPNHRMYVSKPRVGKKPKYGFELAEDIHKQHRKYKKDAVWDAKDYQFMLPAMNSKEEKKVDMDSWLRFLGIWIAEGLSIVSDRVIIYQDRQWVVNTLIPIIVKLGYNYHQQDNTFIIDDKQLCAYMQQFNSDVGLPVWVWHLSTRQARVLLDAMMSCSGSSSKLDTSYYTTSVKLADNIMQLALHCGWSGDKSLHGKTDTKTLITNRCIDTSMDMWRVTISKDGNEPEVNHGKIEKIIKDYDKPVFCLQVPGEVFYVRRNGKAVWTGNSRARGPKQMLTRQPTEGKVRSGGLRSGEMERDVMLGHGIMQMLKERMVDNSDIYTCSICDICGLFASKKLGQSYYECKSCQNTKKISKIVIPYPFMLFMNELRTIGVMGRIRTAKSIITPKGTKN